VAKLVNTQKVESFYFISIISVPHIRDFGDDNF